jgi:hypothetical protein
VLFHHSIRGALEVFTSEAAALQAQAGVTAGQLAGLVERHRFLRSVCMFHTLSEEEVRPFRSGCWAPPGTERVLLVRQQEGGNLIQGLTSRHQESSSSLQSTCSFL